MLTKHRNICRQGYVFSCSHVWMSELDHKGIWEPKNWCFQTVVLEKTLESHLDCKEIKPVHPKDQSWIFIGRTDAEAEAEAPVLWPPDTKNWLTGKDLDAGKDWRQEKGMTRWDGWMASLTRCTWVWVSSRSWWWTGKPGCYSPCGCKMLDMTEWLNWTEVVKNPPASVADIRDMGLIPGSGRSPGGGHCNPLLYSCLDNPINRVTWQAIVRPIA